MNDYLKIDYNTLSKLVAQIFMAHGLNQEQADIVSHLLVEADARGIATHGLSRIRRNLADITSGLSDINAKPTIIKENLATALVDAKNSLGPVVSVYAMNLAIEKAKKCGIGAVSVKNSSHHGISGYYALEAIKHDMMGFVTTNTAALTCPTFGVEARLGTNPIAFCAPSFKAEPFLLDMSTSTVTRGTLEISSKTGQAIPEGWAIDKNGLSPINPASFLEDLLYFKGGLLPLGGKGNHNGGHKGYGLALMVETLSAILSGNNYSINVKDGKNTASCVGHFFMAIDIGSFRNVDEFKASMSDLLDILQNTKPVDGVEQVVYAGLMQHKHRAKSQADGVPLLSTTVDELNKLAKEYNLTPLKAN